MLRILKQINSTTSSIWYNFANIPKDLSPNNDLLFAGYDNDITIKNDSYPVEVKVEANGNLDVWLFSGTTSINLRTTIVYLKQ